ncbi:ectonucleotide pyrophosphatase/phosphodiesterase family member 1 [Kryptolebias marmoratus]|uniref:Ectonucleotide pyrophosphatase/phosphodiesterase 1 n=1 Tax=Kryptolebias marmoratus TaxID=37003 RepID=A0A3Q3GM55_KRYMA|nr:ectonucleotide pyrophosphatase/phosphodiesterase family member 1 [Kryptolebias marmoratus]XP_037837584.1 ectonucleotide pyrophosphatase/phosphodiesterase family member 1 [Kryptolebias marmoratus]
MEGTKGEKRSAEQAASLFGVSEMENQRSAAARRKKRINILKIIAGVLLLLLIVVLAVVISVKMGNKDTGKSWLVEDFKEVQQTQCPSGFSRSPLILISLDGFRAEYLKDHKDHLPVINKIRNVGTTTPYLRPVYPTKTFPNHYSIVTGLYPESHGIVDNKMYDVTQNAFFSLRSDEKYNPMWYQGEPVWITAMHQKLKTATFFWPGSDVFINGTYPNFFKKYDWRIKFETRVSTLFEWLGLPESQRPDFYTLYLEEPDKSGHEHGPNSPEVVSALEEVDWILGMIMSGLKTRNLHQCVNVMIVSDHGMEEVIATQAEFVSNYQEHTSDFTIIQGPAARIRPKRLPEEYFSFDYEGLVKNLSCRTDERRMRPYLKENLPKRMHFANHKRIERGHLYMASGWQAAMNEQEMKYRSGGFHGSDNLFTNMQAIFIGYGPAFKTNTVVAPFENIELYNLMCDLLGIRPSPNNGTHGSLNHLLKKPVYRPVNPAPLSHDSVCVTSDPVPTYGLQCNCSSQTFAMEAEMNTKLLAVNSDKGTVNRLHHPFGAPQVVQLNADFCLLFHHDYLSGYSKDRLVPLWVSYTIPPLSRFRGSGPYECVRADVRIPSSASQLCSRYRDDPDLTFGLLHPPYLNASGPITDSLIATNMVPMFPAFTKVWDHLHSVILLKFSQWLNGINIVSGPIFDNDFDGNVDPLTKVSGNAAPVPTHFFLIMTSCRNWTFGPSDCEGPLQAISYILPHRPDYTEVCIEVLKEEGDLAFVDEWMSFHASRVRDIELLTGLSFYHSRISVEETLQLKTFLHTDYPYKKPKLN